MNRGRRKAQADAHPQEAGAGGAVPSGALTHDAMAWKLHFAAPEDQLMKRALSFVAAAAVSLVGAAAYADSFELQHGQRTPAAAGSVDFNKDSNGNYKASIEAKYLAKPQDLGQKTYAVWIIPGQNRSPQLVGTLMPDKNREAKLDIMTPYPAFTMLITAESQSTPTQPSNVVVLRGQVGKQPPMQQQQNQQQGSGGQ